MIAVTTFKFKALDKRNIIYWIAKGNKHVGENINNRTG